MFIGIYIYISKEKMSNYPIRQILQCRLTHFVRTNLYRNITQFSISHFKIPIETEILNHKLNFSQK